MVEKFYPQANIYYYDGGVTVDSKWISMIRRHYNVKITKECDLYHITADCPRIECFTWREFDPKIVDTVADRYIKTTKPFLGFGGGKKFVEGWCEFKEMRAVKFLTSKLIILE